MPTLPTYTGGHPGNGHQDSLLLQHLGVHLNNKLDWSENTDTLFKKWQSRLSLPRILRSFGGPFWSVILEKSAGQATSLPGTKTGWRDCQPELPALSWPAPWISVEEAEDHHVIIHVGEPVPSPPGHP